MEIVCRYGLIQANKKTCLYYKGIWSPAVWRTAATGASSSGVCSARSGTAGSTPAATNSGTVPPRLEALFAWIPPNGALTEWSNRNDQRKEGPVMAHALERTPHGVLDAVGMEM